MSYQPEERYWTDYLRIALPVIGLLLMLGLFWFWASSLIRGDNSSNAPTATPKSNVAVVRTVTSAVASATASKPPVVVTTPQTAPTATPTPAAAQQQQQTQSNQAASTAGTGNNASTSGSTSTAAAPQFANGAVVSATSSVNMRDQPSTNGNIVTTLNQGDQLTITGPPQQADGYTWYPVKDVNGETGYVAGQFLQAGGQ